MKAEEIIELFRQFESIANEYEGRGMPIILLASAK